MKGIVLFAFNTDYQDYVRMAINCAKRVNKFLNLPVTLITDDTSVIGNANLSVFDKVIKTIPNLNNLKENKVWINKDRCKVFDLTPYDETILLDVDYIINSTKLLKLFDLSGDIQVHNSVEFLMQPKLPKEYLSPYSFVTSWATVIKFKKTNKTQQVFRAMEMIQENYDHYSRLHHFIPGTFRNDYAITLALNIVDGHLPSTNNYIPWNLLHIGKNTVIYPTNDDELCTEFIAFYDNWKNGKIKKEYYDFKNLDFHIINKQNFSEIING